VNQAIDPQKLGDKSVAWLTQFVRDQIKLAEGGAAAQGPSPVITSFTPSSAQAGDTVTITGAGFTFATGVTVNGVDVASFTVVSDTSITFIVPVDATTGVVTVTNPGGSTVGSSLTITVPGPASAWVTDVLASDSTTSSTSLVDTALAVTLGSAGTWLVMLMGVMETSATNNGTASALNISSGSGTTVFWSLMHHGGNANGSTARYNTSLADNTISINTATGPFNTPGSPVLGWGLVTVTASRTCTYAHATVLGTAGDTITLKANSVLMAQQIF